MNNFLWQLLPLRLRNIVAGRANLHTIMANISWLFIDRILRMVVSLFVSIWIARYLGPQQFGLYNYALAFVALFSAFATLGLDAIVIRDIVRSPAQREEILGTAFVLKVISGIVTFTITLIAVMLLRPQDSFMHWLVGVTAAAMILQAFDTIDLWFQSQVKSKYVVYAKNGAFTVVTGLKVLLIALHAPLLAFAWIGLVEVALGAVGLVIVYTRAGYRLSQWHVNRAQAKKLLLDSTPLMLSSIMIMIYMRIDQIMLGEMIGEQEVGIYAVAVRLVEIWYFIPVAIASSVFPIIIASKQISDALLYARLQKFYNWMTFLGYGIAASVSILARPIVLLLFGDTYARAAPMLALLIWSVLFTNLGVARTVFLNTFNMSKVLLVIVFGSSIINIGLNLLLIPAYQGMGAVIASCVAYAFAAYISCFLYKPLQKTGRMLTKALIFPKVW